MVWERVAKFESGALYAEMYLLQNQSRGNRKKKERGETGRKGSGRPPPPELRQIKGRDGGRFDRRKKNARITKQIDETIKQSIVRLTERKGEQRKCYQVVYLKHITFTLLSGPQTVKHEWLAAGVTSLSGERKTVHNYKVNRISLIKFLLSTNEPLVYTMPDWSTNKCNFQPLFGLPWEYARSF